MTIYGVSGRLFLTTRWTPLLLGMVFSLSSTMLLSGCSPVSPTLPEFEDIPDQVAPMAAEQETYTLIQPILRKFNVTSTSLKTSGFLLSEFTCEGADSSPHLAWDAVPSGTQSIAVVAEDLDLVGTVASHWIVWGLPPDTRELPAGTSGTNNFLSGVVMEGFNSYGELGYKGPCPPPKVLYEAGRCPKSGFDSNPYLWTVYALDKELSIGLESTRNDLLKAIDSSILASGSLAYKYLSKTVVRKTRCGHLG